MKPMTTFRTENRSLADAAATLDAEQPMTLRQLFYRLVSADAIHNRPAEYKLRAIEQTEQESLTKILGALQAAG